MNANLYILFILVFFLAACEKIDVPKDTPKCIKKKIRGVEKSDWAGFDDYKVYKYQYKGQTVYYIPIYCSSNCADMSSELYDENCNFICSPEGGIGGNGDGRCPDFHQLKTDEVLIYQKK